MRCIYCNEDKQIGMFSQEHIFPTSIGGKLCDDFFKTREVCRDCNSRAGSLVDGPFLKGALLKNISAQAQMEFVDPKSKNSWAPFFYKGSLRDLELGADEVCEMWEGAHGEHVYHIHSADSVTFDAYAGGNPTQRRREPGRAYLFLTDQHPGRSSFTVRSFKRQFKEAQRYAGNFSIEIDGSQAVDEIPEKLGEELERLRSYAMSREPKKLRLSFDLGANERFMAKLARAMGYKLFGEAYLDSPYGERVRQAMRERDPDKRRALVLYLADAPGMREVAALATFPGAYSIHLIAGEAGFVLGLVLPTGEGCYIVVSDEPALWSNSKFDGYRLGVVYVVAPGAGLFIGPVDFSSLHAHKTGLAIHEGLAELERRRVCAVSTVGHQFTSLKI